MVHAYTRGVYPTKALLKSAEVMHTITHASEYGVDVDDF
ncbi:dihydrolipoamide dehydrogenase [Staphylococcus gallinarum]|uniref:Dihydrolipoamide dehydrogenase n=1 Tax=Staphylococcus gallinarum TaxID=1293 RepID=A0A380FHF0_STAGA|nr:dihydrolipoamide dehydrogenase [Staphylococcus gallinarum]